MTKVVFGSHFSCQVCTYIHIFFKIAKLQCKTICKIPDISFYNLRNKSVGLIYNLLLNLIYKKIIIMWG